MERLADFLRKCGAVLDAGSGSGYLSRELGRLGVKTFAVDSRDYREPRTAGTGYPIKAVHQLDVVGDATGFVASRFGAVLMVWPPLERQFTLDVAKAMLPGQVLVYEGEMAGGCNANDAFFEFVADTRMWKPLEGVTSRLDAVHVVMDTLHDHWAVWRRLHSP